MSKYLRSIAVTVPLMAFGLACFSATSLAAAPIAAPESSGFDALQALYNAFSGGRYAFAAALLVVAALGAMKTYFGDRWAWMHTERGIAILAFGWSMAGALVAGLGAPDSHLTLSLFESAALVGVGAAGGYMVLKHLFVDPFLQPLRDRMPAWMQKGLDMLIALFQKPAPAPIAPDATPPASPAAPAPAPSAPAPQELP